MLQGCPGYDSNNSVIQIWRSTDEARKVFGEGHTRPEYGLIDTVTLYWEESIKQRLLEQIKSDPSELLGLVDRYGPIFSFGVFAGKDTDGNLAVRVMTALCWDRAATPCTRDLVQRGTAVPTLRQGPLTPTDKVQLAAYGMPEIFEKFERPQKDWTAAEFKKWKSIPERSDISDPDVRRAVRLVDLTIAYHPKRQYVGGRVDAVVLTRGGRMEWIQRKPNCPPN